MGASKQLRRLAAPGLGVASFALVLACNGIIGLSDYDRVQCTGNVCDGGGDSSVPPPDGGVDASGVDAGGGTDPVSWARWPMPNYPGAPGTAPKLDAGGGVVTDEVTKLRWRQTPEKGGQLMTQAEALAACAEIAPAGDWRLPKRIELVTLLDFSGTSPFIDPAAFPSFPQARVWSSSEVRPFTRGPDERWWVVHFETGAVEPHEASKKAAAALCVRAR